MQRAARTADQARFIDAAQRIQDAIARRVDTYIALLRGAAAFLGAKGDVTPTDFHEFVSRVDLVHNYPGSVGLGFAPRVEPGGESAFAVWLAARRVSGLRVRPALPSDRDAFPVAYLEPQNESNRQSLGFDMFSDPPRREAMERARDRAEAAATGAIPLEQNANEPSSGFLLYAPLYREAPPDAVPARRSSLIGFVYTPLRLGEFLRGALGRQDESLADFSLYQGSSDEPDAASYRWGAPARRPRDGETLTTTINVAGLPWTLVFDRPAWIGTASASRLVPWAIAAGVVLSVLLAITMHSLIRAMQGLRQSDAALRSSEAQYRASFALAAVGKAQIAPSGRFLRVNARLCEITGYSEEELVRMNAADLAHPDDREGVRDQLQRLARGHAAAGEPAERRFIRKDSGLIWLRINAAMVRDDVGRPVRAVAVIEDVTRQRAASDEVRRSEALLKAVVETAADGIITIDEERRILSANPAAERLFGHAVSDLIGVSIGRFMPGLTTSGAAGPSESAGLEGRPGIRWEAKGRRRDGNEFPVELSESETRLGDRRIFTVIFRDISERRAAEAAVRATENRFRVMADAAPVLLWIADANNSCTWFNQRWLDFVGRPIEEELGEGWMRGVHPDDAERCAQAYARSFELRQPFTMEFRLRRHDGQWRWVLDHGMPLDGAAREFTGFIGSCVDITDRKSAEQDLERYARELARQAAELARSNADLADFAHVAAHDLKEPLRGMRHTAAFLIEDFGAFLGENGRERLERLDRLAKRMHDLLDSILEFGQVGSRELALRECDINTVLSDVRLSLGSLLQRENSEVASVSPLPVSVRCDRVLVGQVFSNLIANGVKYNDRPRKRIEIGAINEGPVPVLFVRDNGIGIDPAHHRAIFRMFKRLHTRDRYGGGSGAGLAIAKRIVERHGGRIWLESTPGAGTTFYFTLAPGGPLPPETPEDRELPLVRVPRPAAPASTESAEQPASG